MLIFVLLLFLLDSTATPALPPAKSPGISPVFLRSMNVAAFAGRAIFRSTRSVRKIPRMLAVMTPEFSHGRHFKLTSFDLQCFAPNQRVCHLLVCRFDNPPKG